VDRAFAREADVVRQEGGREGGGRLLAPGGWTSCQEWFELIVITRCSFHCSVASTTKWGSRVRLRSFVMHCESQTCVCVCEWRCGRGLISSQALSPLSRRRELEREAVSTRTFQISMQECMDTRSRPCLSYNARQANKACTPCWARCLLCGSRIGHERKTPRDRVTKAANSECFTHAPFRPCVVARVSLLSR
jgi:hypothetical protein